MRHALAFFLAVLITGSAMAGEPIDSAGFYASRPGQLFKGSSLQPPNVGFIEGDETSYQTWEGMLSGKKLYVELHGDQLNIFAGRRKFMRNLVVSQFEISGNSDSLFCILELCLPAQANTWM